MQAWWERDQIISAFIVGTFSMTAAMISMVVHSRRIETAAKKAAEAVAASTQGSRTRKKAADEKATSSASTPARRGGLRRYRRLRMLGLVGMFFVGLVVGSVGYRVGASTLGALGLGLGQSPGGSVSSVQTLPSLIAESPAMPATPAGVRSAPSGTSPVPEAATVGTAADGANGTADNAMEAADSATEAAGVAPGRLSDWLRSLGTRVYYRYAERLPVACSGAATVHGSWDGGGDGEPVRCVDRAWLVFDLAPLLESGRLVPDRVYCFNFRDEAGRWAAHDPANSPGLEGVAMDAPEDVFGGSPLGLRVIREGEAYRIAFATAAVSSPC